MIVCYQFKDGKMFIKRLIFVKKYEIIRARLMQLHV